MNYFMALTILITLLIFSTGLAAQDKILELVRADVRAEKTALIRDGMDLTDKESSVFWPLYREYEFELSKVYDSRLALIKDYVAHYDKMTDEKARELIKKSFALEEKRVALKKKFYPRFEKALSSKTAAKFFYFEKQLDLLIDLKISSELDFLAEDEE